MEAVLKKLIKLHNNGSPRPDLLQELRLFAKNDTESTVALLIKYLQAEHSQQRYLVLLVLIDFFPRSYKFRCLLLDKAKLIVSLVMGTEELPLPKPLKWKKELSKLAIDTLGNWISKFKDQHNELVSVELYIKGICDSVANDDEDTEELPDERVKMTNQLLLIKYHQFFDQLPSQEPKIMEYLKQLNNAIEIMIPDFQASNHDEDEILENHELGLPKSYSINVRLELPMIEESSENIDIIEAIRENLIALQPFKIEIENAIEICTKVDDQIASRRNSRLRYLIDWKFKIANALERGDEILNRVVEAEEEEDFEEIQEEYVPQIETLPKAEEIPSDIKPLVLVNAKNIPGQRPVFESLNSDDILAKKYEHQKIEIDSPTKETFRDPSLEPLFEKAPVVEYGLDLEYWSSDATPKIEQFVAHPGLEARHRFNGSSANTDQEMSNEFIQNLRKRTVYLNDKFESPKPNKLCRFPLKNGKICRRGDKIKCPFPGLIVPRDETGKRLDGVMDPKPKPVWEQISGQYESPTTIKQPRGLD